jgi:hypothetical protein
MMPATLSILSGLLLLVFLWRFRRSTTLSEIDLTYDSELPEEEWTSCPKEFVATVFCPDDWEFVSTLNSESLKALFERERKSVARSWVLATSGSIRRIMREHTLITRRSTDLQIGTEMRIYLRYVALQASCGALLVSIDWFGPARLRLLSSYVYRLSERLRYAHWALKAATETKELEGLSHS